MNLNHTFPTPSKTNFETQSVDTQATSTLFKRLLEVTCVDRK